jgi:hypothetical protein
VLSGFLITLNLNPDLDSAQAASTWTQDTDKDFSNGTLDNLTIVGGGKNAALQIDLSDLKHWIRQTPGSSPPARGYHGGASIDGDDKAVIYGGAWNRDDTWEYDLSGDTWTDQTKTTKPPARYYNSMASIDGDDKAVTFGGRGTTAPWIKNDTWEYDSSTSSWTQKNPQSFPTARMSPGMAPLYGYDKALLFGGYTWVGGWTYFNDSWVYDSSDGEWIQKSPSNAPGGRHGPAMATFDGTDKVLLYGGQVTGWNFVGETWLYDFSTDTWTNKNPSGGNPGARGYAAMAPILNDDKMVLFGGFNGWQPSNFFNDTWVYDLSDNTWTKLDTRNTEPTPRGTHTMSVIDGTDKVLLFGGMTSWNQFNGETWLFKYSLPFRNGTYTSAPYDTGTKSDFLSLSWFAKTPVNTKIEIKIRTADTEESLKTKDFIGPDGTTSSFYTASPTEIWDGHYGDRWVQYIAYFNLTVIVESPSLEDLTITYNCLPNTIVVSPTDGTLLSKNKPTFKWTFEDNDIGSEQKAFQIVIDDDINFTGIEFDSGEQNTDSEQWDFPSGTGYSEIPDGLWYWKIRTKDADEAWTEFSLPRKLWIDTQSPNSAPDYPANEGFYNSLLTITGVANDGVSGSGLNKIEIAINRLTDNNYWSGTSWVPLASWLGANGTETWIYDSSEIKWTSGTRYSVQSRAVDKASNIEGSNGKNVFTIDKDSPESNIDIPTDNTWINKVEAISGNSIDISGAGVEKVEVSIQCSKDFMNFDGGPKVDEFWTGSDWSTKQTWFKATGTNEWSLNTDNIPFMTGDHYLIQVRAIDKTDNLETPGPGTTFMYDAKPPEELNIYINNDDEFTKSSSVILSLHAVDVGSGLAQMAFSTDSAVWSNWETFNTSRSFELPTGDGKKTIYFKVNDFTDNEATHVFDTIILDTMPPEDLMITINDDALYTGTRHLKLDLRATDRLSGVKDISFSYDGLDWFEWEAFKQVRYIDLPPHYQDGELKIYYKARDNSDNVAAPVYDSIILDTLPPFSLSMIINSGAIETNSTSINLDLFALDNTSGVSEISFSNNGNTWSEWESFVVSKSYTLPVGNGQKTIFYLVRDKAGNVAQPIAKTIKLNITTPKEREPSAKSSGFELDYWMIMIIVIVVILILIIVALLMVMRKKRRDQDVMPAGAVTIRPGGLGGPMIGVGAQFGSGATPTQYPQLAKSTQTAQPTVAQAQVQASPTVMPQPLPALPPARISSTTTPTTTPTIAQPTQTPSISTPPPQKLAPTTPTPTLTPTIEPTPAPTPTPTISTPAPTSPEQPQPAPTTTTPTPSVAAPSPSVHLPDTTAKPTVKTEQPTQKNQEQSE